MRALKDSGLDVSTPKHISRDLSSASTSNPPSTPPPNRRDFSPPPSMLKSPQPPASNSTTPSPHEFVSPLSFGPPSPSSSPASSPRPSISQFTFAEFSANFPSIAELEEFHKGSTSSESKPPPALPSPPSSFPVIPIDPGPRPSSTPITPSALTFVSRSPSPDLAPQTPRPSYPPKPTSNTSPNTDPRSLPVDMTIQPKLLHEYMQGRVSVLLIDVRTRAEFDKEHIKTGDGAVVCMEPSVLMRDK
jgi:ubiquitin carboxyl-terminal hydrolase 8